MNLLGIVNEWAEQSGELLQDVLANLGSQDWYDQLPPKTIRFVGGENNGTPEKLNSLVDLVRNGEFGGSRGARTEAMGRLVAKKSGILEFCTSKKIKPPRSVVGLLRWMLWRGHQSLAPLKYPLTIEEHEEVERNTALARKADDEAYLEAQVNEVKRGLTEMEARLQEAKELGSLFSAPEFDSWGGSWAEFISKRIGEISDRTVAGKLSKKLESLVQECAALKKLDKQETEDTQSIHSLSKKNKRNDSPARQPEAETQSKKKIYDRLCEEWKQMPDALKALATQRGERHKVLAYLESRLPDVSPSSIDRELRNVVNLHCPPDPEK